MFVRNVGKRLQDYAVSHPRRLVLYNIIVPFTFQNAYIAVEKRLRHYAASRKVAGSSPDEVDFF
jgi:hypothetical protein